VYIVVNLFFYLVTKNLKKIPLVIP
jgi:hypothetical protein